MNFFFSKQLLIIIFIVNKSVIESATDTADWSKIAFDQAMFRQHIEKSNIVSANSERSAIFNHSIECSGVGKPNHLSNGCSRKNGHFLFQNYLSELVI